MPITSPVERISGPRMVSTPPAVGQGARNRLNGMHRFLDRDRGVQNGRSAQSPRGGSSPSTRSSAIVAPSITEAAAFASGVAVALETKGTVREALGLASRTYSRSEAIANWMLIRPRTPTPRAIDSVAVRIRSMSELPRVIGGSTQAESRSGSPPPRCAP